MNEVFATSQFTCGDGEALVTYLYGEGTEAEREQIAAHVARCVSCAEELAAIGATREQLAAWTPPDRALGFQLTPPAIAADASRVATIVPFASAAPSGRWWNQPLPAWAQMAAAVAIFASGLAIGAARNTVTPAAPARTASAAVTPTAATTGVSREELAQLESRLKGEIAQVRTSATPAADDSLSLQRVNSLIATSEQRQQREFALRMSDLITDVNNQRKSDLINYERRLNAAVDGTARRVNTQIYDLRRGMAQPTAFTPSAPFAP
jgi:hypothetical protein